MKERKSLATFKDGHTEEIFYFEKYNDDIVIFATRSGVYVHRIIRDIPGVFGIRASTTFFKVGMSGIISALDVEEYFAIESITLDERVEVSYSLDIKGRGSIMGKVLVAPNAEFNEIRNAILDELRDANAEKEE